MILSRIELGGPLHSKGVLILAGYLSAWRGLIDRPGIKGINGFVFYFALPLTLFHAMATAPLARAFDARFVLAYLACAVAVHLTGMAIARWVFRRSIGEQGIQGIAASFGNLVFIALPIATALFGSAAALPLALLVTIENGDRHSMARTLAAGSVLVILALLFRPVALPLVAFWTLAIATWLGRPLMDRFGPALLAAAAVAGFIAIVVHAYVLMHPSAWPFGSLPEMLSMVAGEYREGMFVHNASPPMLVAPATDVLGFIRITLQKLLFFITPWLPHYSTAHTLLNLLFFVPAYGLSIAAITNLRRLAPPQQRAAVVLGVFVLLVSVFHAMLLIDSDHRYRVPVVPALIMLSAIGLESARRPQTLASIARTKSPATARDRKA